MTESELTDDARLTGADPDELRKEALTMALYVSVCLLAALAALDESADQGQVEMMGLVWGTTVGLALAHLFAFRLSARLVGSGTVDRRDGEISIAQLVGAISVAVICTVPILPLSATAERDVVRLTLAGLIGLIAYFTARSGGVPRHRALLYAFFMLVAALAIAVTKNVLAHH